MPTGEQGLGEEAAAAARAAGEELPVAPAAPRLTGNGPMSPRVCVNTASWGQEPNDSHGSYELLMMLRIVGHLRDRHRVPDSECVTASIQDDI